MPAWLMSCHFFGRAAGPGGHCCEQDHHRWPFGLVRGHLLQPHCIAACCRWPGFAVLLDATELIALAWPVSGIPAGWPIVAAGSAARSAASRFPVCIAIAIHNGFMG
jgi:hypothetical protein